MLNLWGDQTIQVSVLWAFYFLGCAWDSYSISWKQKKGPRDLMHQPASCFLNINLTFPTYLVEGGVQNTRNHTLTALYVLLSILRCEESHYFQSDSSCFSLFIVQSKAHPTYINLVLYQISCTLSVQPEDASNQGKYILKT